MMNDEAARQGRPDTNTIPAANDSSGSGGITDFAVVYCEACGARAPTDELLERHRTRRCVGPIEGRHVVLRRLHPNERAAFKRRLQTYGR